jgi:hypothetical protein
VDIVKATRRSLQLQHQHQEQKGLSTVGDNAIRHLTNYVFDDACRDLEIM